LIHFSLNHASAGNRMLTVPFGDSWSGARWQDFALSIFWLFDNNATAVCLQYLLLVSRTLVLRDILSSVELICDFYGG
jgi:hypothetical protein